MGSLQTCQMLQLVNCIHMVKLFIPFSICHNMILITYRLGSWKKALELNKVKHKPFYKWPWFRLERMQMTTRDGRRSVWSGTVSGDRTWLVFKLGTWFVCKERIYRTVMILLLKSGLNANAWALLLTFFLPRDRVCLYKKKLLSGQTSPSTWKTLGLDTADISSFETFFSSSFLMVLSWAVFFVSLKSIWHSKFKSSAVYLIQEKKQGAILLEPGLGCAEEKTAGFGMCFPQTWTA